MSKRPGVHLFVDGEGGMVTRCENILAAQELITEEHSVSYGYSLQESFDMFSVAGAKIERGRIVVQPPGGDYSWVWKRLGPDTSGPGVTTAVVWYN